MDTVLSRLALAPLPLGEGDAPSMIWLTTFMP
jgi:hypothetical protein